MATIEGPVNDRLAESAAQKRPLGTRLELPDGRVFRYTKAGGVALDIGKLMAAAVVTTGHIKDLAVAATAAIGDTSLTITNATTAITEDQYAEGYVFFNTAAGQGQICTIRSHPAETTTSGSCVLRLEDEDALTVALTTSSKCGLRKNIYKDVIVSPNPITGIPVGVTPIAVTEDYYFWLQTWGPAAVLTNGVLVLGQKVATGETTPGSVDVVPVNSNSSDGPEADVGLVINLGATTEYSLVFLTIAP